MCDFSHLDQVRLWPFNKYVVVGRPITLCRCCQYHGSVYLKEQLATRVNTIFKVKKRLTLFTFNFAKRMIRPPNAYLEFSNINHFGSISAILGRLASECKAS